jgi:hypothetical protein
MKIITYSESHPTIMRTGTTTDHLTCVIFISDSQFGFVKTVFAEANRVVGAFSRRPTKRRKHPNFAPGTKT